MMRFHANVHSYWDGANISDRGSRTARLAKHELMNVALPKERERAERAFRQVGEERERWVRACARWIPKEGLLSTILVRFNSSSRTEGFQSELRKVRGGGVLGAVPGRAPLFVCAGASMRKGLRQ